MNKHEKSNTALMTSDVYQTYSTIWLSDTLLNRNSLDWLNRRGKPFMKYRKNTIKKTTLLDIVFASIKYSV
jgi:hypothetical protein